MSTLIHDATSQYLGWVPAVPDENGEGYYWLTCIPPEGMYWWRWLPNE